MRFSYKIFRTSGHVLLAISDISIIGKKYSEGDLEIEVKKDFYYEETCDEKNVLDLVEDADIVNAVGKGIISFLIKNKIIDENSVIYIKDIPHAQIIVMSE